MAQRFTSVLAVLGIPTDDGRVLAADIDLQFRDNLPLLWQKETSGGDEGHKGSVPVGVIETASIKGNQVVGDGYFLTNQDASDVQDQITESQGKFPNPSVDLGDATIVFTDENGNPVTLDDTLPEDTKVYMTMTAGKLLGATLVTIPAFGETSITLVDAPADAATPPAGDAKKPVAPAAPPADPAAAAALIASLEPDRFDRAAFTMDEPDHVVPIHFTADGHVMGHLAEWNRPHRAFSNRKPPRSASDYADFHQSHVYLEDGDILRVGRLTVGGGHGPCGQGAAAALAHYDDVSTTWAYVRAVNGRHGIWVCGVVNPRADEKMAREAMSAPHSGHWEKVGGRPELIAAHAVVVPGLPIYTAKVDSRGNELALVASFFAPQQPPADGPPAPAPKDAPGPVSDADKKFLTGLSDQLGQVSQAAVGYKSDDERVTGIAKAVADAASGLSEKIGAVVNAPADKPTEEAGLTASAVSMIARNAVTEYRRQEREDHAKRLRSNSNRVEAMAILQETGKRRAERARQLLIRRGH